MHIALHRHGAHGLRNAAAKVVYKKPLTPELSQPLVISLFHLVILVMMNVIDPILFQCRWQPSKMALCAPGTIFNRVSYGSLEKYIHNVGQHARECGLERGDVVSLMIRDPILHAVSILGLTKIGVVTISGRDLPVPKELKVDAIFADSEIAIPDRPTVTVITKDWATEGSGSPSGQPAFIPAETDWCRIVLTSGTTGEPKAIVQTYKQTILRGYRIVTVFGNRLADCSRVFIDMSLSTGGGFLHLIHTLTRGGTVFMHGPKVADTLDVMSHYRVQLLYSAPRNLSDLCDACDRLSAPLDGLEMVISGGSLLTPALSDRVRARICTNLVSTYGSSEASVVATAPAVVIARVNGAVGYVTPGAQVDVVDPAGNVLPAGNEGLVRIRGAHVVDRYLGDPAGSEIAFRKDGFYPGDIGTFTSDGLLVIRGREQAIINLSGNKINPERVEAAVTSFPLVRDAAALTMLTTGGIPMLACAIVWRDKMDEPGLRDYVKDRLPTEFIPKLLIDVDMIPRNASGKIDRARVKDVVLARAGERRSA